MHLILRRILWRVPYIPDLDVEGVGCADLGEIDLGNLRTSEVRHDGRMGGFLSLLCCGDSELRTYLAQPAFLAASIEREAG
jgi:hypothetical protein